MDSYKKIFCIMLSNKERQVELGDKVLEYKKKLIKNQIKNSNLKIEFKEVKLYSAIRIRNLFVLGSILNFEFKILKVFNFLWSKEEVLAPHTRPSTTLLPNSTSTNVPT